jgi:hypothetical protein
MITKIEKPEVNVSRDGAWSDASFLVNVVKAEKRDISVVMDFRIF